MAVFVEQPCNDRATMPIEYKVTGNGTDLIDAGDFEVRQPQREGWAYITARISDGRRCTSKRKQPPCSG